MLNSPEEKPGNSLMEQEVKSSGLVQLILVHNEQSGQARGTTVRFAGAFSDQKSVRILPEDDIFYWESMNRIAIGSVVLTNFLKWPTHPYMVRTNEEDWHTFEYMKKSGVSPCILKMRSPLLPIQSSSKNGDSEMVREMKLYGLRLCQNKWNSRTIRLFTG